MRAALRWIRADLRARKGQALAVTGVVTGVMTALLLSAALLLGATNPWQGLFAKTRGAQIWLHLAPGTDVRALRSRVPGITAVAGPYSDAAATLVQGGLKAQVEVRAMSPSRPAVGLPLLRSGRWLATAAPRGVVLEASFAQAVHAAVGSVLVLDGLDGAEVRARVVGLAETSDQGFYPDQVPGLIWALPGLLRRVEPIRRHTEEVAGLRLANPAADGLVVQQAVTQLGSQNVISVSTWQQVEHSMARRDPLLGLLLALFGLVALGAAVLAIMNATGGRVLVQLEDLAMLKTLGFTPGQVTAMLVAEHAALGLAGITAGTAAGVASARLLSPLLLSGGPAGRAAASPPPTGWAVLIAAGVLLAIMLATAVPAWRAGRARAVAAIRPSPPRGHLSRLARAAMASRFPPAIVLGARAAFVRKVSAVLVIGGLAVPMLMITIGLGFWSTLDRVQGHPGDIGLAAGLTVSPGTMSRAAERRLIATDSAVAGAYRCVEVTALLPGETTTITTLGMGTSARPYPFHVAAGSLYHAPGQAVATQGLLDTLHLRVGGWVGMPIGGVRVVFHIVGRIIDPADGGQVLAYGRDTLVGEGAAAPPVFYSLVLRRGRSPDAARAWLLRASGNRLDVQEVANPAGQLGVMRILIAGLIAVLALIGLTNLATASAVGLRDHLRDVRVLQALGLTPLQVGVSLVARISVLALVAVGTGAMAGLAACPGLINMTSRIYGIGAGLGRPPSTAAVAVAVTAAVAVSALTAAIPARRAAQLPAAAVGAP